MVYSGIGGCLWVGLVEQDSPSFILVRVWCCAFDLAIIWRTGGRGLEGDGTHSSSNSRVLGKMVGVSATATSATGEG